MGKGKLLFVFALLLVVPNSARAFEFKLWPLGHLVSSEAETSLTLFGPIVEWRSTSASTTLAFRPLFHAVRDHEHGETTGVALYPLAWWSSSDDGFFLRFFGLVTYDRTSKPSPAAPAARQFTLFPFVHYREREDGVSFAVLPLFADLEQSFGYERIRMLFFPLYLELVTPLETRTWYGFPFFSRVSGKLGTGTRFWPVYGRTRIGRDSETVYVGWPFYIRRVDHPGSDGQVEQRISWPIFSTLRSRDLESRTLGYLLVIPLYTHTIDRKAGLETYGFPWPFWLSQRKLDTGERTSLRLMPFFQDRRSETIRSVFYFWPFYRRREGLGELAGYERTDVLLFLYRDQREEGLHTRVVWPFWISRTGRERDSAQAITFVDGLFPKNDRLESLYAPLYRVAGREGAAGDLLWKMWEWSGDGIRPPWYVSTGP